MGDSLCGEEGVGVILIDSKTVQGLQGDWSSSGGIDVRVRNHLTRPLTCQQIPSSPQAAGVSRTFLFALEQDNDL